MNRLEFFKILCIIPFVPSIIKRIHYEFKIGDKVVNTELGPKNTGTILNKVDGQTYREKFQIKPWDMEYPNWRQNYIYYVRLDNPSKVCTLYEYIQQSDLSKKKCRMLYNKLEKHDIMCLPADDLRLI